ncbi:helix-turn-helix transcriptional regulator [Amycolatopsis sp. NPDC026612]|uniref:response regulator transcription factor n=1 Tax=Amycolatopsis sp. NPDC026612 TaxID=3155466 RepID=UPI0033DE73D9
MSADAVLLYRFAVACPDWTSRDAFSRLGLYGERLEAAIETLVADRLFRPATGAAGRSDGWEAVSPHGAVADLLAEEEGRLHREQATLVQVREDLLGLLPSYIEARRDRAVDETLDVVEGRCALTRLLAEHAGRGSGEVCVASSGSDSVEAQWVREVELGNRGPARVVVDHADFGARFSAGRASVRTVTRVPTRLVMFGRSTAFLPVADAGAGERTVLIRHPTVVESLAVAFELLWGSALPAVSTDLGSEVDGGDGERDHLRREILRHLAEGEKDEMVARRMGLSVRTCRRHIAAIMDGLGASSRFQAGVLAQKRILDPATSDDGQPAR